MTARTAGLFPGQGCQRVGMADHLLRRHPDLAESHVRRADEILGLGLGELCAHGPATRLAHMPVTQPAILLVEVMTAEVLRREGVELDVVAGHSLGEFAAMVAAGVLGWEDALALVRRRGELMASVHRAVRGKMAAVVGLTHHDVEELCAAAGRDTGEIVEVANYNEPRQIVISGQIDAVDRLCALATGAGAERALTLDVTGPAHCSLLHPIEAAFGEALDAVDLHDPQRLLVSGLTGRPVTSAEQARECLGRQFTAPVLWSDALDLVVGAGVGRVVELGPGKALSNISARRFPQLTVARTGDTRQLDRLLGPAPHAGLAA